MFSVFKAFPSEVRERALAQFSSLERDADPCFRRSPFPDQEGLSKKKVKTRLMCPIGACLVASGIDAPLVSAAHFSKEFEYIYGTVVQYPLDSSEVKEFIDWWDGDVSHFDGDSDVAKLADAMGVMLVQPER